MTDLPLCFLFAKVNAELDVCDHCDLCYCCQQDYEKDCLFKCSDMPL